MPNIDTMAALCLGCPILETCPKCSGCKHEPGRKNIDKCKICEGVLNHGCNFQPA